MAKNPSPPPRKQPPLPPLLLLLPLPLHLPAPLELPPAFLHQLLEGPKQLHSPHLLAPHPLPCKEIWHPSEISEIHVVHMSIVRLYTMCTYYWIIGIDRHDNMSRVWYLLHHPTEFLNMLVDNMPSHHFRVWTLVIWQEKQPQESWVWIRMMVVPSTATPNRPYEHIQSSWLGGNVYSCDRRKWVISCAHSRPVVGNRKRSHLFVPVKATSFLAPHWMPLWLPSALPLPPKFRKNLLKLAWILPKIVTSSK